MYVPKITKATIQAAAMNASAQSHMATQLLEKLEVALALLFELRQPIGKHPDRAEYQGTP